VAEGNRLDRYELFEGRLLQQVRCRGMRANVLVRKCALATQAWGWEQQWISAPRCGVSSADLQLGSSAPASGVRLLSASELGTQALCDSVKAVTHIDQC